MKAADLLAGLAIILRNQPETEADIHGDTLFVGSSEEPMPAEDEAALEELGWSKSEESWAWST